MVFSVEPAAGQSGPPIVVNSSVPSELNPPFAAGPPSTGGAPAATPAQAAAFAWQEFIALNWPAGPQQGNPGQRDTPSSTCRFGDPAPECGLLVWETLRAKVEIFPGDGAPPGYRGSTSANSWGYDALPAYNYNSAVTLTACDAGQTNDATPWINLDETDQITLNSMYAGVVDARSSPGNSEPKLIRFLAKANRSQYNYVAGNSDPNNPLDQWWVSIPGDVRKNTIAYLDKNNTSPPAGGKDLVSLPYGTIELKAGWRPLNPAELASGRFHTQMVRFYTHTGKTETDLKYCYTDAIWGLVALHIIQKTPSAPYFIYATFEQADNILTSDAKPVEDADGNIVVKPQPATATTPQVCLNDPIPNPPNSMSAPSVSGSVILTSDPATCKPAPTEIYCDAPGSRLYYRNTAYMPPTTNSEPSKGDICVNKRENAIPDYVIDANQQAHAAIASYLKRSGLNAAPWLSYKLINIQYFPYDKIPDATIPNGSPYTSQPPYSATNPAPSSYYQANIVVETNRSLQLFAGGLSPNISTEWNQNGTRHTNTDYSGQQYNMGGCMGCHGSQGQSLSGDFSVILARGSVFNPEGTPKLPSQNLTNILRNRALYAK